MAAFRLLGLGIPLRHSAWSAIIDGVKRVIVVGRGAAGKSTAAAYLGRMTGLPVTQLDKQFWSAGLRPTPPEDWARLQRDLTAAERWILDGDLGSHDVLAPRLARADTVLVFDFSLLRCAWRALRRSRERADFWRWLITWRRGRDALHGAISEYAPGAVVHVLRSPRDVRRLLYEATRTHDKQGP